MKSEELMRELKKKYSPLMFEVDYTKRIPFDVFSLDYATGGGIPQSRITILWGDKSAGKTTMALRVARNYLATHRNMKVIFVDYEQALDKKWFELLMGSYADRVVIVTPLYGEQGIDITVELAKAEDVGLIIVDSIASMIPTIEADSKAGEQFRAIHPRLVNSFFRRIIPIVGAARYENRLLTLLLINQVTVDMGKQSFLPLVKKPGGKRQDLLASLDIRFYPGKYRKVGGIPISVTHSFTVTKNKTSLPQRSGEFTMNLVELDGKPVGYIEEVDVVLKYAQNVGVIKRDGNVWILDGKSYKTKAAIKESMNDTLLQKIKKSTLNVLCESVLIEDEKEEEVEAT